MTSHNANAQYCSGLFFSFSVNVSDDSFDQFVLTQLGYHYESINWNIIADVSVDHDAQCKQIFSAVMTFSTDRLPRPPHDCAV